ncbi:hypothetical protein NC653_034056 [Populus alba x Populus x berolinensis]|uniref:Uncharacterized protein n=1 Tax=Populus alba x Populus x berolinensis TaxID=444605 RepID=A0AAD6PVL0_9ROSI|nr:hypothetical protein NC653_034056 [Populus alba x Populus x berolinensis]
MPLCCTAPFVLSLYNRSSSSLLHDSSFQFYGQIKEEIHKLFGSSAKASPPRIQVIFADFGTPSNGAKASTKRARSPLPILELNQDRTPRSNHIYRGPQSLGFAETPSKITSSPSLGIPTKALIITKEPKLGTSQSPGLVHFPNFTSLSHANLRTQMFQARLIWGNIA